MRNKRNYEQWVPVLISCAGGITLIVGSLFLFKTTPIDLNESIKTDTWGNFGTVIGGIVGPLLSLAGIFLLIETLKSQRDTLTNQGEAFEKQQVTSHFFELLQIQRENSNIIREEILGLLKEFEECFCIVKGFPINKMHDIDELRIINIAYLFFYFGATGVKSVNVLKKQGSLDDVTVSQLSDYFRKCSPIFRQPNEEPFNGNQIRLGHYYRHLYQLIKFIDEQDSKLFSYDDKYKYIKNVRAQLSTQEQVLLFYNSLSKLGEAWESGDDNNRLITKYNLIKNIPDSFLSFEFSENPLVNISIDHKRYYSDVHYEGTEKTQKRLSLEKQYS